MEIYQKQEEARLEAMKDTLRKLVVYETSCLRNLQYDIDNLAHVHPTQAMEGINIKSDIKLFIDENATPQTQDPPYVFVPYQGTHPAFMNLGISPPIATIPHAQESPRRGTLNIETAPSALDSVIEKAWLGLDPSSDDFNLFQVVVREKAGRRMWGDSMTQRRISGRFELSAKGLEKVSQQMICVLTECQKQDDSSIAKVCLMAANTFFAEDSNHGKSFLHAKVAGHPLWQQPMFWEQAIDQEIEEELKQGGGKNAVGSEGERIRNVAFCQLGAFAHNMVSFDVDRILASELISKLSCKYDLSNEDMTTLNDLVTKPPVPVVLTDVQRGVPQWLKEMESHVPVGLKALPVVEEAGPPPEITPQAEAESEEKKDSPSEEEPHPETVSEAVPEVVSEAVPDVVSEAVPEVVSDVSETKKSTQDAGEEDRDQIEVLNAQ